jgi:crossover junction endodeoxyribonuclease RuvC
VWLRQKLAWPLLISCQYFAVGITPQQFAQMQSRTSGGRRPAAPVFEIAPRTVATKHQIIMGVDASLRGTGYGIIRLERPHPQAMVHGTVLCSQSWEHSRCLVKIAQTLREVIAKCRPTVCVLEGFYCAHLQTVLAMGQARGVALATAAEAGLEVYEIAPRKVKQAIVGYGAAQKEAVAKMVQRLLQLTEQPASDAADALAAALAYAQENGRYSLSAPKRI